jgi:Flp pilus assembly protein TadG
MLNQSNAEKNAGVTFRSRRRGRIGRGQAAVEFAMISTLALLVMLVGVQYALIGQAALADSQGASALARYAAINPGTIGGSSGNGTVTLNGTAAQNLLSSSICGGSCSDLTATIVSISASTGTANTSSNPPAFGDRLTITLNYDATNKLALPKTFLGMVTFPTALGASESQVYE